MASRGGTSSIFDNASSPNIKPNKSFSIKSILDLPEQSADEHAQSSSNSSSVESCSVSRLPLVPRAVRPMVHHHADNVPPSGPMNWQDFGVAPLVHHWSYGALPFRNHEFPFGKCNSSIKRFLVAMLILWLQQEDSYKNYGLIQFVPLLLFSQVYVVLSIKHLTFRVIYELLKGKIGFKRCLIAG